MASHENDPDRWRRLQAIVDAALDTPECDRESLLTRALVYRTLLVSALLVVGSWWAFRYELAQGASLETSRTEGAATAVPANASSAAPRPA